MVLARLLQPDLVLGGSVLDLTPELLRRYHLRGLILDVDDTLVPFSQAESDPDLADWMVAMKAVGQVWLVSNNVNVPRIRRIADEFKVPYLTSAGKPSRRKLKQALQAMALPAAQVAMVGDRLFTDILAGNRLGLFTILVEPMPRLTASAGAQSPLRLLEVSLSQSLGVTLTCSLRDSSSNH
ncbi:MAG TPA: YqeG family HAD IIIA-type phosphatase [Leptolyngbyaceae cyanobacterium M65_K2018_010]|nr:YqeG family HAD IIIA-type phosphatase [Leptolyngbyaceae cyanobacterium M65_K2018_010]